MAASRFVDDVRAALHAIDAVPSDLAFDAQLDGAEVECMLGELRKGASLLLRVAPELGERIGAQTPTPAEPVWLRLQCGSPTVRGARQRARPPRERASGHTGTVDRVIVDVEGVPCCRAETCAAEKYRASVWLHLADGTRLLVTEQLSEDREGAGAACRPLAVRLAEFLGVALEAPRFHGEPVPRGSAQQLTPASPATPATGLRAEQLARFALRTEGGHVVMRDYESRGPSRGAGRELIVATVLALTGIGLWFAVAREVTAGASMGSIAALVVVAVAVSVASYGFLGAAWYSAQRSATSKPLLCIHEDHFVVAPSVARDGAVKTSRLDGDFGGAIAIKDWRAVSLRQAGLFTSVDIDSRHGLMEVLSTDDVLVAERLRELLERHIRLASHA